MKFTPPLLLGLLSLGIAIAAAPVNVDVDIEANGSDARSNAHNQTITSESRQHHDHDHDRRKSLSEECHAVEIMEETSESGSGSCNASTGTSLHAHEQAHEQAHAPIDTGNGIGYDEDEEGDSMEEMKLKSPTSISALPVQTRYELDSQLYRDSEGGNEYSYSSGEEDDAYTEDAHDEDMMDCGEDDDGEEEEEEEGDEMPYTFDYDVPITLYQDVHDDCERWAVEMGACNSHPRFMLRDCIPSCLHHPEIQRHGMLNWSILSSPHADIDAVLAGFIPVKENEKEDEDNSALDNDHDGTANTITNMQMQINTKSKLTDYTHYFDEDCVDSHQIQLMNGERHEEPNEDGIVEGCHEWMMQGLCRSVKDKEYMLSNCSRTCGVCLHPDDYRGYGDSDSDSDIGEEEVEGDGYSDGNGDDDYTYEGNGESDNTNNRIPAGFHYNLGVVQLVPEELLQETVEELLKMVDYMEHTVLNTNNDLYQTVRLSCANEDDHCAIWAAEGRCEPEDEDYEWMALNCAPVCQTCELADFAIRCPIPEDSVDALTSTGGGDVLIPEGNEDYGYDNENGNDDENENGLHAMFERIVGERALRESQINSKMDDLVYKVRILSRPSPPLPQSHSQLHDDDNVVVKKREILTDGDGRSEIIMGGPWVITLENFITDKECESLIQAGVTLGYNPSVETYTLRDGSQAEDFKSQSRTSTNAWCDDECRDDPAVKRVQERIATVTGFPVENSEDLQLLHYEEGQFYKVHHDLIGAHIDGPSGPRVLTFFLYLNDVEEGGGTRFPELLPGAPPVTVQPKRGTALVWPSVLDNDVNVGDFRTEHEALAVVSGVKYGANAWIHLRSEHVDGIECT